MWILSNRKDLREKNHSMMDTDSRKRVQAILRKDEILAKYVRLFSFGYVRSRDVFCHGYINMSMN